MAESSALIRVIGPCRRKIITCDVATSGGQRTAVNLRDLGWRIYNGPATVDARGFIVPGSDTRIVPAPLIVRR